MRNIFDQYEQVENRVTHALLTSLDQDRDLLGHFLRDLVRVTPPVSPQKLTLLSQRYPGGELAPTEDEAEQRGIPDGWVFNADAEWCVFLESKVQAPLSLEQLSKHRRVAERFGFRTVIGVVITSGRDSPRQSPPGTVLLRWREVYVWLVQHRHHHDNDWAARAAQYLEIVESRLIETGKFTEGTLTMFAGISFSRDQPYYYLEGKRLLLLMCETLRASKKLQSQLGVDPAMTGKAAIKGSQADGVWNY